MVGTHHLQLVYKVYLDSAYNILNTIRYFSHVFLFSLCMLFNCYEAQISLSKLLICYEGKFPVNMLTITIC